MQIIVQGLTFEQAYIFGEYLPSESSIETGFSYIKDRRNKRQSSVFFNEITKELEKSFNPDGEHTDLDTRWRVSLKDNPTLVDLDRANLWILKGMCKLLGYDFPLLMQVEFIFDWHLALFGNYTEGSKATRERMSKLVNLMSFSRELELYQQVKDSDLIFSFKEKEGFVNAKFHRAEYSQLLENYKRIADRDPEYPWMKGFPECERAYKDIIEFNQAVGKINNLPISDIQTLAMAGLIKLQISTNRKTARIIELSPKTKEIFWCPDCKTHSKIQLKNGNMPAHCRSCQKLVWKFDRVGFCEYEAPIKDKKDIDCYGEKRLNSRNICSSCYRSNRD